MCGKIPNFICTCCGSEMVAVLPDNRPITTITVRHHKHDTRGCREQDKVYEYELISQMITEKSNNESK